MASRPTASATPFKARTEASRLRRRSALSPMSSAQMAADMKKSNKMSPLFQLVCSKIEEELGYCLAKQFPNSLRISMKAERAYISIIYMIRRPFLHNLRRRSGVAPIFRNSHVLRCFFWGQEAQEDIKVSKGVLTHPFPTWPFLGNPHRPHWLICLPMLCPSFCRLLPPFGCPESCSTVLQALLFSLLVPRQKLFQASLLSRNCRLILPRRDWQRLFRRAGRGRRSSRRARRSRRSPTQTAQMHAQGAVALRLR